MSSAGLHPSADRDSLLLEYFAEDFQNPKAGWHEIDVITALWRVAAIPNNGNKSIIAVRTSELGTVDSFAFCLDIPDEAHVVIDTAGSFSGTIEDVQAQTDMGLTSPNTDELELFEELVDAIRLIRSI